MSKVTEDLKKFWAATCWTTVAIIAGFLLLLFLLQAGATGCVVNHVPQAGLTDFHVRKTYCYTLDSPQIKIYRGDRAVCPEQEEVQGAVDSFLWGYHIRKKYDKEFDGWKMVYVTQRISCPGNPDDWEDLRGKQHRGYTGCSTSDRTTITLKGRATFNDAWTGTTIHELCHKYGYIRGKDSSDTWHDHHIWKKPMFGAQMKVRNQKEGFCFKSIKKYRDLVHRKL